ncbi:MAG: hypothetical protein N2316_09575 [Spirochaetes bacterium]|nr:hypothetical protein [Spirochaetota bacterium]
MCLASIGANVVAYDKRVPSENCPWDFANCNPWHDDTWFFVEEGNEKMAGCFPERTLFLCWPPLQDSMATEAALLHRKAGGRKLIFVGSNFSCANEEFFKFLDSCRNIVDMEIPSWPTITEVLRIVEY